MKQVLIEGYTSDELLNLPTEQIAAFVFVGEPIVFNIGSAEILGSFRLQDDRLVIELAQIDGGGEGVLPTLWTLATCYADQNRLKEIDWIVHAVNCAQP